jgi:hypothetical protein
MSPQQTSARVVSTEQSTRQGVEIDHWIEGPDAREIAIFGTAVFHTKSEAAATSRKDCDRGYCRSAFYLVSGH